MMKLILLLLLSAVLAPASFATITLDGQEVTGLKLKTKLNGKIIIKSVTLSEAPTTTPPTCLEAPADPECTGPTFCEENPTDQSCSGDEPGPIDTEGQDLVFETLNWVVQPGQRLINIPRTDIIASRFTTTDSQSYSGYITLVASTGTGHVSRNLWVSTSPGGVALQQPNDRCDVSGSEVSLRWSQKLEPRSQTECKLATGTTYYLNYGNEGCTTSVCEAFRNTRHNGEP